MQNRYRVLDRQWESVLEYCHSEGIAFIPWFPIGGGMTPMTEKLQAIAGRKQVTMHQLTLSWQLHRSGNILLIPGTSSIGHLEENMRASEIVLDDDDIKELNGLI